MAATSAFVTVGTTKFDALIEAVDSAAVADELAARGFKLLIVQRGAGNYIPQRIVPRGESNAELANGLHIKIFDFAPNLDCYMQAASLIISHAGSGSIFEALSLHKPLIAVPNAILMANHQVELAQHLSDLGHCASAAPETLLEVLQGLDMTAFKPYQRGDASKIVAAIDDLMSHSA